VGNPSRTPVIGRPVRALSGRCRPQDAVIRPHLPRRLALRCIRGERAALCWPFARVDLDHVDRDLTARHNTAVMHNLCTTRASQGRGRAQFAYVAIAPLTADLG